MSSSRRRRSIPELLMSSLARVRREALEKINAQNIDDNVDALIRVLRHDSDRITTLKAVEILKTFISHSTVNSFINDCLEVLKSEKHTAFLDSIAFLRLLGKMSDMELAKSIAAHLNGWKLRLLESQQIFRDYSGNFEVKPRILWAIGEIQDSQAAEELLFSLGNCLSDIEGEYISSRFRYLTLRILEQSNLNLNPEQIYHVIRTERIFDVYVHALRLLDNLKQLDTPSFWGAWINRPFGDFFVEEFMGDSFVTHFMHIQPQVIQKVISDEFSYYRTDLIGRTWNTSHWLKWSDVIQKLDGFELLRMVAALALVEGYNSKNQLGIQKNYFQNILDTFTQDNDVEIRVRAIRVKLYSLSTEDKIAAAQKFLLDPYPSVRTKIYQSISLMHNQPDIVIPWLIKGLHDEDSVVVSFCLENILNHQGYFSLYGREMMPAHFIPEDLLKRLMEVNDENIKSLSWVALIRQSPQTAGYLLSDFLDMETPFLAKDFFQIILRYWGWQTPRIQISQEVVLKLKPLITHQDSEIASEVINGLSIFRGEEHLKMLEECYEIEQRYRVKTALKHCLQTITQRESI